MISTHRTREWKLANLPVWQWLLLDKHSFLTLYHRPKGSPVESKNSFEVSFHKSRSTLAFNDSIALCLALKVTVFGTWRWPILVLTATSSLAPYRSRLLIGSCPLVVNYWRHDELANEITVKYLKMQLVSVISESNLNVHSSRENRRQRYSKSGHFNDVVTCVRVRPRDT